MWHLWTTAAQEFDRKWRNHAKISPLPCFMKMSPHLGHINTKICVSHLRVRNFIFHLLKWCTGQNQLPGSCMMWLCLTQVVSAVVLWLRAEIINEVSIPHSLGLLFLKLTSAFRCDCSLELQKHLSGVSLKLSRTEQFFLQHLRLIWGNFWLIARN